MKKIFFVAVFTFLLGSATTVSANHSWGGYHWARTANPFVLKLGNNVSTTWSPYLDTAIADWATSTILDLSKVAGGTNSKTCKATLGRVEVCSDRYGNNGWLGIAQIWVNGTHITKAITKMNDTYFNTSTYNKPAWRRLVMCQELAHSLGLDHQDETFNNVNLGTCMDYTNAPAGGVVNGFNYGPSNEHPNLHDYEELGIIYSHLDSFTTIGQQLLSGNKQDINLDDPKEWGKAVKKDSKGHNSEYVRDLGNGEKLVTHVISVE